ncbi:MAG: hypothetical protein WC989_00030 [Micavibrio sp.]
MGRIEINVVEHKKGRLRGQFFELALDGIGTFGFDRILADEAFTGDRIQVIHANGNQAAGECAVLNGSGGGAPTFLLSLAEKFGGACEGIGMLNAKDMQPGDKIVLHSNRLTGEEALQTFRNHNSCAYYTAARYTQ